jgi:hypothetical protein
MEARQLSLDRCLQEARLHEMEARLRAELRAESAGHLREVADVFLLQLNRNALRHNADVQTDPPQGALAVLVPGA